MLSLLHIENIAVIEKADIAFSPGLSVLTGETGAGKSIIIDAIYALMGQRTSRELIRRGAESGFVSGVFSCISREIQEKLLELGLSGDEPETLYIQREILLSGKTVCRVNMRPANTAVLKELGYYLMNVHGQHDGQKLLGRENHIDFLDNYCNMEEDITAYEDSYRVLLSLRRRIAALQKNEQVNLQRMDALQYHMNEIDKAELTSGEEKTLREKKACFDHYEQIFGILNRCDTMLNGTDDLPGMLGDISAIARDLLPLSAISQEVQQLYSQAEEIQYAVTEFADGIRRYMDGIAYSQEEHNAVEARLDLIQRMKQKYGASVEEILEYRGRAEQEWNEICMPETEKEELYNAYQNQLQTAKEQAGILSERRKAGAVLLRASIEKELADLAMEKVRIEIRVTQNQRLTAKGMDTVEFLIATNPGSEPKPLEKIASGGELSRIMLALKNVLTEGESVGTLIFDEIDTGVSGRAAGKIAKKLYAIGQKKQTLCVTHLPQIAAMGDHHLMIEKEVEQDRTVTHVFPVEGEARVLELSRLISADEVTQAAKNNAIELLTKAAEYKKKYKGV